MKEVHLHPAACLLLSVSLLLTACAAGAPQGVIAPAAASRPPLPAAEVTQPRPGNSMESAAPADRPVSATAAQSSPVAEQAALEAPESLSFELSIARASQDLFDEAVGRLGGEPRPVVIDPLIDANTGAQTISTKAMGEQLASMIKRSYPNWTIVPLNRQTLAQSPLLLIGTLTPINVQRAIDTPPDAFRVWLTLIDLRTGRVVAKKIDRSTISTVNPEPLPFYRDSPTWHKDRTVLGYINSCQINTKVGDLADPDYLARLPAAAVLNEAIEAYDRGLLAQANKLYKEAAPIADPGDLRMLNGLYLTSWQLGQRDAARDAFSRLVDSGLDLKRLPMKILFVPGKVSFYRVGDLPEQYELWINSIAHGAGRASACIQVVGHTSRTGPASVNARLSRQRAETVEAMLKAQNRALSNRLSSLGVGSREALVGLGTDDLRDALDRRVEFRVVDCV